MRLVRLVSGLSGSRANRCKQRILLLASPCNDNWHRDQFFSVNPIKALYWSAVINGVVAVPVMITMMHMTSNPKVMGKFPVNDGLRLVGWLSTAVMGVAAVAMTVTAIV